MLVGMVVPYFHPASQYGGTPRAAFELARALAGRGHRVRVLTTDSAGGHRLPPTPAGGLDGIEVHYYRNISNYLAHRQRLFLAPRFHVELRTQLSDCDVLHIHEFRSTLTIPAASMARKLSLPYVLSTHGGLSHLGKHRAKTLFDILCGRSILDGAAAVLVLTKKEEAEASKFRVPGSRIRHLPNLIEPSDYEPLPRTGLFRDRWKIGPGKMVLFLGRLHAIKGIDLLVEAFAALHRDFPGSTLVLAGPDDGEAGHIQSVLNKLGLRARTIMTGFLDHQAKLEALVDSNVVVLPSRSEGSPVVLAEALLCYRPVVASSGCDISMAEPSKVGILRFKALDVGDLRDKLLFALIHDDLSDNAMAGHQFVLREFSSNMVVQRAEAIYQEALFPATRLSQV